VGTSNVTSIGRLDRQPGRPWQVLIVEDDPVIAAIYRKTIATTDHLCVAGAVTRGEDALAFVQHRDCDLILLDLRIGGMNGVRLLHQMRAGGSSVEVIALTATRNSAVVRDVIQHGAIEYLVKPFTIERLRNALALFVNRARALQSDLLDQAAVDVACAGNRGGRARLPKGLTLDGLARVRAVLATAAAPRSATEVACVSALARVTARRYLEYLVSIDEAVVDAPPSGPGRPRKLYHCASGVVPSGRSGEHTRVRALARRVELHDPDRPVAARSGTG
jgi:response regulator of citrate/malate metabolism